MLKNKKFKKLTIGIGLTSLSLVSMVGISTPFASAASKLPTSGKTITIGVAMSVFNDVWLNYLRTAMAQYASTNPNIKVVYADANNDASTQLQDVNNFITEQVNAIVVNPADPQAMQPILSAAYAAHIPVITVNRRFPGWNGKMVTSYVGSQSVQAGTLEMTQAAKLLHGKGNIAIMLGQLGQTAEANRLQGIKNVLKKYPKIHVVLEGTASWNRAPAMSLMENWLHSGKHINALVSENDEMAIGAILAIKAAGLQGKIIVTGTDGTPEGLGYIKTGQLAATVYQSALGQGTDSIKLAYEAALGKKVPKFDSIPYELVTKANVNKYENIWASLK